MKFIQSFFISAILACAIFYATVFSLIEAPVKAGYWIGEMIEIKKELVKEYANKRKIIIAGGSSTLFGIDAEFASKSLNTPVINFGLTAGVPLEKILKEVNSIANQGDLVILPLEPSYFDCNSYVKKFALSQVTDIIGWDHDTWKEMNPLEKLEFVTLVSPTLLSQMIVAETLKKVYPIMISDRLGALDRSSVLSKFNERTVPTEFAYSAYNLDNYGDMLGTEGAKYKGKGEDVNKPLHVCDKAATILMSFVDQMKNKGVQVFFANTPYLAAESGLDTFKSSELNFTNELAHIGCIIDKREDLIFDRKYFFNSNLHLNPEGRLLRTEALIKAIHNNALSGKCGLTVGK